MGRKQNRTELGFNNISGLKHLPIRVILPAASPKIWGSSNPFHRLCDAVNPPARSSLLNFSLLLHSSCNFPHFRRRPPTTGDVISPIFPLRDAVIFLFPWRASLRLNVLPSSASFKKRRAKERKPQSALWFAHGRIYNLPPSPPLIAGLVFYPVWIREPEPAALRVAVVGARVAFFSRSCLLHSLRTNKMAACCFYSSGWGGGKVGGAVTLVKGGGRGDGDRDFPDSTVSVLLRSCDWGPAAASDDGVTRSEMMPTLWLGLQNIGFAIAGGTVSLLWGTQGQVPYWSAMVMLFSDLVLRVFSVPQSLASCQTRVFFDIMFLVTAFLDVVWALRVNSAQKPQVAFQDMIFWGA